MVPSDSVHKNGVAFYIEVEGDACCHLCSSWLRVHVALVMVVHTSDEPEMGQGKAEEKCTFVEKFANKQSLIVNPKLKQWNLTVVVL